MTSINWSLLGPPVDVGASVMQGFNTGRQMRREVETKNALAAYMANPNDTVAQNALATLNPQFGMSMIAERRKQAEVDRERARMASYGQMALTDPRAARAAAIGAGQFDIAESIGKLDAPQKDRTVQFYKTAAPIAYRLRQMPPDQRAAFFEQAKPILLQNGGDPQTLASFDVTNDVQLDAFIAQGRTVEQMIDDGRVRWNPVGENGLFAVDSMGRPVGSQNPAAAATGGARPAAPTPSAPPTSGGLSFNAPPSAQVTSDYRTPEHNRRVGGVENSYHTRRTADGQPMARDFVPPPGMSMGQLHAELTRLNPGMEVINEGDHVHLEPLPGRAAPAKMASAAPIRVTNPLEMAALPSGTVFIAPDGSRRIKP